MSVAGPGEDAAELDALAEEYVERLRRGEAPDLEEYVRAYPHFATKIRRLFPLLSVMEGVSDSTVESRPTGAPTHPQGDVPPDDAPLPETIGRYRVVRLLGRGGMGRVYEARAPAKDGAEATVAIKVIHPHLMVRPGYVDRFLREAEAGRRVEHPNLVGTLAVDALDLDGVETPYLVLEYVEGQTLRALLREVGEVPERLCRHIGIRVADALAAIHAEGIVHRDVKPENVLITTDEVVKVMDLGVALLQDEALRISRTGDFVGSLLYAAPEQLDGRTPDGRADLYALGRVLFELVCGRLPPRHESLEADWNRVGATPFFGAVLQSLLAPEREERIPEATQLRDLLRAGEQGAWWRKQSHEQQLAPSVWQALGFERPTRFFGRESEFTVLMDALARARAGKGQVLLVEGEAGSGKSRLLYEWAERLDRTDPDVRLVVVRHRPGAGTGEAGDLGAALVDKFGDEQLEVHITDALGADGPLADVLRRQLRGEGAEDSGRGIGPGIVPTAWLRLLRSIAADGPLALVFEDLHFGSADAGDLFRNLAAGIRKHRILIVGSTRPVAGGTNGISLEGLEHGSLLRLEGLEDTHCRALVREAWGGPRPPESAGLLIRQSDGNPFFLLELVRTVRQRVDAAGGEDAAAVAPTEVPSSVRSLIEAQLAHLSEEDRELVQAGACVGFEFDPVLVADVAEVPPVAALKRFGRLERSRGLLAAAGARYRFRHHLVQETLYQEMHPRLRETYHAAIGRTLLARIAARGTPPSELPGSDATRVCHHLFAGGSARDAGPYVVRALDHLVAQGEFARATGVAQEAVRVEGVVDGEARVLTLEHLGRLLRYASRYEESCACLEAAIELADRIGFYPATAVVRSLLGFAYGRLGEHAKARPLYEAGAALARERGDGVIEAVISSNLVDMHVLANELDAAHELALDCLEKIRGHDRPAAELEIIHMLGRVESNRGDLTAARAYLEQAADLADGSGFRASEAAVRASLGFLAFRRGDFAEAQACLEVSSEMNLELGLRDRLTMDKSRLAACLVERGYFEEARAAAVEGVETAVRAGRKGDEISARAFLGRAELCLGHWDAAVDALSEAAGPANEGEENYRNFASRFLYLVHCGLGRFAAVEAWLEVAIEKVAQTGHRQLQSHFLSDRGRAREQIGDLEGAEQFLQAAHALRDSGGSLHGLIPFDLGRILIRRGNVEEGRPHLEAARDWAHDGGAEGLEARARIHLALLPGGDPLAARLLLEQHETRIARHERVETQFAIWEATQDPAALRAAHEHLLYLVEHAPAEDREAMVREVDLFRRVEAAWHEAEAGAEAGA